MFISFVFLKEWRCNHKDKFANRQADHLRWQRLRSWVHGRANTQEHINSGNGN